MFECTSLVIVVHGRFGQPGACCDIQLPAPAPDILAVCFVVNKVLARDVAHTQGRIVCMTETTLSLWDIAASPPTELFTLAFQREQCGCACLRLNSQAIHYASARRLKIFVRWHEPWERARGEHRHACALRLRHHVEPPDCPVRRLGVIAIVFPRFLRFEVVFHHHTMNPFSFEKK